METGDGEEITEEIGEAGRIRCDCVLLRNRKRLTEYIQKVFVRLFQHKKQATYTNVFHRLNL